MDDLTLHQSTAVFVLCLIFSPVNSSRFANRYLPNTACQDMSEGV